MRHNVYGKRLSRTKNERTQLFRGLVRNLLLSESITTTEAKAKAIKGLVDTLISKSQKKTPGSLREVESFITWADVRKKLVSEVAPRYKTRVSGFTTVVKMGRRQGDGAMMVKMSLISESVDQIKSEVSKSVSRSKETGTTGNTDTQISSDLSEKPRRSRSKKETK